MCSVIMSVKNKELYIMLLFFDREHRKECTSERRLLFVIYLHSNYSFYLMFILEVMNQFSWEKVRWIRGVMSLYLSMVLGMCRLFVMSFYDE